MDLAPIVMRGKADLQEASMILMSCEEVKLMHGGEEHQSAGRLVVPEFPDGSRIDEQGPSSSGKDQKRDDEQGGSRRSDEPMQQD